MGNINCGAGPREAYTDREGRELNSKRLNSDVDDPVVKNRNGDIVPPEDGHEPKGAHVYLNVYDLMMVNLTSEKYGLGVYHTGVEVLNDEYSFIGGPDDMCSIIKTYPGDTSWMQSGRFKESLYVGRCLLTKFELQALRIKHARAQPCSSYDLLANNCNHFSQKWIREITGNPYYELPARINRMATMGDRVRCCLPDALTNPIPPHVREQQAEERERVAKERAAAIGSPSSSAHVEQSNGGAFGYSAAGVSQYPSAATRASSAPVPRQRKSRMPSSTTAASNTSSNTSQRALSRSGRSSSIRGSSVVPTSTTPISIEEIPLRELTDEYGISGGGGANDSDHEEGSSNTAPAWSTHQAPYVNPAAQGSMQPMSAAEAEADDAHARRTVSLATQMDQTVA